MDKQYRQIIENANRIQEGKSQLAMQIVDQQFGEMVNPDKFEKRIELLVQLQQVVEQVKTCLSKCSKCMQQNEDNTRWIQTESSVFI